MLLQEKEREQIREQIEMVECYLEDKKKTTVVFDQDIPSGYCDDYNYIVINTRQNLRYQLHTLLHEAGHVLIRSGSRFREDFPGLFKRKQSRDYKVDVLREEVLAWEKGLGLAKRMSLSIDETWWRRHSNQCLYDYAKWAGGNQHGR